MGLVGDHIHGSNQVKCVLFVESRPKRKNWTREREKWGANYPPPPPNLSNITFITKKIAIGLLNLDTRSQKGFNNDVL